MANQAFVFKQFTIHQDKCAMKVGTDAVILGSWVNPGDAKKILDIGTGTGIIALMLAQKSSGEILAIDIEKESCEQAIENVKFSKWPHRVKVHNISLQDFATLCTEKFDLIVSNPPYFIDSLKSREESRAHARHSDTLPFDELISSVKKLLHPKGKFYLILPPKEADLFRDMAKQKGLSISKLLRIRTREDKSTEKRQVMRFEFKPKSFSEETIVIEKDQRHEYTEQYIELTKDFYLQF
jgi:tRNA1Val (adenine37-N6)-methyltransferase